MAERTIYTIGRQFGSGGRQVGKALAERLGIPYYDKELLAMAAKDSGFSESLFHDADEKPASSLLYSLVMGNYPMSSGTLGFNEMPLNDQLFLIQSNTIRKVASKGSCVMESSLAPTRCFRSSMHSMGGTLGFSLCDVVSWRRAPFWLAHSSSRTLPSLARSSSTASFLSGI